MKKGFTLIELLVVIAIIGILASIVLVSFPGASKKAKDARIVSAISQARTVMTYVQANDGSYTAFVCATNVDLKPLCDEVAANNSDATEPGVNAGATAACIYSQLNAKSDYWYCADSTGVAGFTTIDPSLADTYCGGTTFVCSAVSG